MGQAHEPLNPQPLLWAGPARNGSWTLVEHYGPKQAWGQRTLRLPQVAEGQENLRISFRANGGWWINVSAITVTADGNPVATGITGENNSAVGGDGNHIAYGHGWFTADLDSRGLTNLEVTFTLISEAAVDVHVSDGGVGLNNIALGIANTTRVVDGQRVGGAITCTLGGNLPNCDEEKITITLDAAPPPANATCPCPGGNDQEGPLPDDSMHLLQVHTPGGLNSNEFLIFD
jgi:hypothetical protein